METEMVLCLDFKHRHAFVYQQEDYKRNVYFSFDCDLIRMSDILGHCNISFISRLSWCHNMEVSTGKLDIDFIDRIVIL